MVSSEIAKPRDKKIKNRYQMFDHILVKAKDGQRLLFSNISMLYDYIL